MTETQANEMRDVLFGLPDTFVYAVLDGARIGGELVPSLAASGAEHVCLYRGKLEPSLAACAPYLAKLRRSSDLLGWLLRKGWGRSWGIFLSSGADLVLMRRHLRRFLVVASPQGKSLYFRYYDPRVFRVYLPTCTPAETRTVFGPVQQYVMESEDAEASYEVFRPQATGVEHTQAAFLGNPFPREDETSAP